MRFNRHCHNLLWVCLAKDPSLSGESLLPPKLSEGFISSYLITLGGLQPLLQSIFKTICAAKNTENIQFQISKNRDSASREFEDLQFRFGSNAQTIPTMSQPTSNANSNILQYRKYVICLRGSGLAIVPLELITAIVNSAVIIIPCITVKTIKYARSRFSVSQYS